MGLEPKEIDEQSQYGEKVEHEEPKEGDQKDVWPYKGEIVVPMYMERKFMLSEGM